MALCFLRIMYIEHNLVKGYGASVDLGAISLQHALWV